MKLLSGTPPAPRRLYSRRAGVKTALLAPRMALIKVFGDLDLDSAPALHQSVAAALAASTPLEALILHLGEVDFCAAAGLNAIAQCQKNTARAEIALAVVAAPHAVWHPLQMIDLDRELNFYPSLPDALLQLSRPQSLTAKLA